MFRGYFLLNSSESFNIKKHISSKVAIILAVFVTSIIFSLGHLNEGNNAPKLLLFHHFISGIVFSLGYVLTGKFSIPIAIHSSYNFFTKAILSQSDEIFLVEIGINIENNVSILLHIISIIIILLSGLTILGWIKYRYGKIKLCTSLSKYNKNE